MVDISKLGFYSELNYMKRSDTFGVDNLTYTSSFPGAMLTKTHGLGYVPFFLAGVDLFNDGVIWSNQIVYPYTESSSGGAVDVPPLFFVWGNADNIIINLRNGTDALVQSGSRKVYYGVYIDYA